ncbi:MAG: hypothetical protein IKU32_02900 [Clostridia bacterium]|nr:hypothetical protein [Clostridia bacterium]
MKTATFMAGIAAGMVMAGAVLSTAYPDVPRRMSRDARKVIRCGKRMMCGMFE